MKISNETKIGTLAAVTITVLILGFNFLKGKEVFERPQKIYAVFKNVEGIENSNAVRINGLQIGNVADIQGTDLNLDGILVTIALKRTVNIPVNSIASISSGLISSSYISINKGDATEYLKNGDTIATQNKLNLVSTVEKNIDPIVARLNGTLESLDSLIQIIGSLFDPRTKNNFTTILSALAASSVSLQALLNRQTGDLSKSLRNLDTFTTNLNRNNEKINKTLDNLEQTTDKLSNAKIQETVASINETMSQLKEVIGKLNSSNGSLGLLINDKRLYLSLESSSRSLNTLLDDFRLHPKRYVNVSVFGRKDKTPPIMSPLADSSSKSGIK
jgi:phospholipid/cholesterol/gamma-HCH transport system substrate-binding protein